MALNRYLKQLDATHVGLNLGEIPDRVFIDAIQVVEVQSAQIMTRQQRQSLAPGAPDVMLRNSTGGASVISRSQLVNNYVLPNGRKITMAFRKEGKPFTVIRNCSNRFKIMQIPSNARTKFNGKIVRTSSYVVCPVDETGQMMREKMFIVSRKMFRKMFKIPPQDIITRHINSPNRGNTALNYANIANNYSIASGRNPVRPVVNMGGAAAFNDNSSAPQVRQNVPQPQPVAPTDTRTQNQTAQNPMAGVRNPMAGVRNPMANNQGNQPQAQSVYRFTVVAKCIDTNSRKIVGYRVKELASGKVKSLSTEKVILMCRQHAVDNMMLVTKEGTNTQYLRGNNMRIESLPEVIV